MAQKMFEKKKSKYLGSSITSKKSKSSKNGADDSILRKDQQNSNSNEKEVWKYEGEVDTEGRYTGIGKLSNTQTGEFYEGQWGDGMREGFGAQLFPTGERYQGAWKLDKMDGPGVVSYPNGDTLQGVWENGKRVYGTFQFNKGVTTYKEKWTNDFPGPRGQLDYNTGGRYVGEVGYNQEGRYTVKDYVIFRQGYGEMFWSNNNKYIGYWKTDKRKGYGILLEYGGPKYYGTWTRGKKSGYGIEIFLDGTYYEGSYMHDERKGKGKVVLPNGDVVLGEWNKNNCTNVTYHHGAFNDVPRPLRAVFLENVTAIQKTEDKSLFTSTEKWSGFVNEGLEAVNFENFDFEKVLLSLSLSSVDKKKGLKSTPFSKLIDMFVNVFIWEYEGIKGQPKKEATYSLQTAVDDVHSFLACVSLNLTQRLSLDYKRNKSLYENLMMLVFARIYHVLFPLYQQVYKSIDANLRAKVNELKGVTTALIGVKPRFHLDPSKKGLKDHTSGKTGNQTSESEGTTNAFRMMMTVPPPLPGTPSPPSSRPLPTAPETGLAIKAMDVELDGRGAEDSSVSSSEEDNNTNEVDENLSEKESDISGSENTLARPSEGMSMSGDSTESIPELEGKKISKSTRNTPLGNSKNGTILTTSTATTVSHIPLKKERWAQKRFSMTVQNPLLPQQPILQQPTQQQRLISGNSISSSPPPSRASVLPIRVSENDSIRTPRAALSTSTPKLQSTISIGPYQKVIESLTKLSSALNPLDKLQCISNASNSILSCVDEFYNDKTEKIIMGAEDKFPVLIYALIRANVPDLWCHCNMIQDFVSEHLGDEESKYRASEFIDALKYIQSLDWNLRDKQDILIPLKLIISSVGWAVKGIERLKFPENVDIENEKFEILISLSDIFRALSQRRDDIYSSYKIPGKIAKVLSKYENFFTPCVESKDLGLKLRKETSTGSTIYFVDFELTHPVYVYQKLSETCVTLETE